MKGDKISLIKTKLTITDALIEAGAVLIPAGPGKYRARCPFPDHQEQEPSFTVDATKGTFTCFGCNRSGDVINFVAFWRGITLQETIRELGEELGVGAGAGRQLPESLHFRATHCMLGYYTSYLQGESARSARNYLHSRGLTDESIKNFQLGTADTQGRLLQALTQEGFDLARLKDLHLLQVNAKTGRLYDPFWGRMVFPIFEHGRSSPTGFVGRAISPDAQVRYINSQNNEYFRKGVLLYGMHLALPEIIRTKEATLVEGCFDVISVRQWGLKNVVGSLGTGVTPEQIRELARHADTLLLISDGDPAGRKAILDTVALATQEGLGIDVCLVPESEDPDSCITKLGNEAFGKVLEEKRDGLSFCLEWLTRTMAPKKTVCWVQSLTAGIKEPVLKSVVLKRIALFLEVSVKDLESFEVGACR